MEGEGACFSTGNDMISELPNCVIGIILSKLPIVDAIRTSLLSTCWRYKWRALADLVFDEKSLNGKTPEKAADFITKSLFLHNGSIHKFSLESWKLKISPNIDQWLLFVSRKDVRELVVELGESKLFHMPSCVFSCKNLIKLALAGCAFDVPPYFNGFVCLKHLELEVAWDGKEEIERLLSTSPLLEIFKLSYFYDEKLDLTLHAQNLVYLYLEGDLRISLVCTPLLVDIFIDIYTIFDDPYPSLEHGHKGNFYTFFGSIPKLERLIWKGYFLEHLSIPGDGQRMFCEATNKHLKSIQLHAVDFGCSEEVLILTQLIKSSPSLKDLMISSIEESDPEAAAATQEHCIDASCNGDTTTFWTLGKLQTVEFINVSGLPSEVNLIKLVVTHSPNLEVMRISCDVKKFSKDRRYDFCVDLLSCRRASTKASIVFAEQAE